jgi:hypothetical protein
VPLNQLRDIHHIQKTSAGCVVVVGGGGGLFSGVIIVHLICNYEFTQPKSKIFPTTCRESTEGE